MGTLKRGALAAVIAVVFAWLIMGHTLNLRPEDWGLLVVGGAAAFIAASTELPWWLLWIPVVALLAIFLTGHVAIFAALALAVFIGMTVRFMWAPADLTTSRRRVRD